MNYFQGDILDLYTLIVVYWYNNNFRF